MRVQYVHHFCPEVSVLLDMRHPHVFPRTQRFFVLRRWHLSSKQHCSPEQNFCVYLKMLTAATSGFRAGDF